MGGIGKTQLALEYAFKNEKLYDVIWFINGENLANLLDEYNNLYKKLMNESISYENTYEIVDEIKRWCNQNEKWLIIFDNVDNEDDIYPFLPQNSKGDILITTRNGKLNSIGCVTELNVFSDTEALDFMTKRTGMQKDNFLDEIINILGKLPLACEQASAYIKNTGVDYKEYLDLFQTYRLQIFNEFRPLDYKETVATTWLMSLNKLDDENAIQLLRIISFLAPENINSVVLEKVTTRYFDKLNSKIKNRIEFDKIIAKLKMLSLIKGSRTSFSIHRLLQEVIRDSLDNYQLELSRILWSSHDNLDFDNSGLKEGIYGEKGFEWYKWLCPHLEMIAGHGYEIRIELEIVSFIYNQIGAYYNWILSDCNIAEGMFNRSLEIRKKLFMSETTNDAFLTKFILSSINNIGLYMDKRNFKASEKILQETFDITNKYGYQSLLTEIRLKTLYGDYYAKVEKIDEAKEWYSSALDIEAVNDEEHLCQATTKLNLAAIYLEQGRLEKAYNFIQESLPYFEQKGEEEIVNVALAYKIYSDYYYEKRNMRNSEKFINKTIAIFQEIYPDNHPELIKAKSQLTKIYALTNRDIEEIIKDMLDKTQQMYGENSSEYADILNISGHNYLELGKKDLAEKYCLESLKVRDSMCDFESIERADTLSNLGNLYIKMQKTEEAEMVIKQSLNIRLKILGKNHQKTLDSYNDLGVVLYYSEKYLESKEILSECSKLSTELLGEIHYKTLETNLNLAFAYFQTGEYYEAKKLYWRNYRICKSNYECNSKIQELYLSYSDYF